MSDDFVKPHEFDANPNQAGHWDDNFDDMKILNGKSVEQLKALAASMRSPDRIDDNGNFVDDNPESNLP